MSSAGCLQDALWRDSCPARLSGKVVAWTLCTAADQQESVDCHPKGPDGGISSDSDVLHCTNQTSVNPSVE